LSGVARFDGGAHGDFYGWGGCGGDFSDVGDSGGADFGVGDARNVLVDVGSGADGAGTERGCGRKVGDGEGESFEWADEFADAVNTKQGSRETGKQGKTKSEVLLTQSRIPKVRDREQSSQRKTEASWICW
jgi:hypothetical protein